MFGASAASCTGEFIPRCYCKINRTVYCVGVLHRAVSLLYQAFDSESGILCDVFLEASGNICTFMGYNLQYNYIIWLSPYLIKSIRKTSIFLPIS